MFSICNQNKEIQRNSPSTLPDTATAYAPIDFSEIGVNIPTLSEKFVDKILESKIENPKVRKFNPNNPGRKLC